MLSSIDPCLFHLSYDCTVFWGIVVGALVFVRRMSESRHSSRHGSFRGRAGGENRSVPSPEKAAKLEAEV